MFNLFEFHKNFQSQNLDGSTEIQYGDMVLTFDVKFPQKELTIDESNQISSILKQNMSPNAYNGINLRKPIVPNIK